MVVGEVAAGSEMSLANMVLGFYEEAEKERWPEDGGGGDGRDDEGSSGAGSRAFWQEQHSQLHVSLLPSIYLSMFQTVSDPKWSLR